MNAFLVLFLRVLAAAPSIVADIEAAFNEHWGQDHVQQAVKGIAVLNKVATDVATAVGPTVETK